MERFWRTLREGLLALSMGELSLEALNRRLRAFVDRWGEAALRDVVVAVIGPTTAAAARALDVRVDVMPDVPSMPALARALAAPRSR